MYAAHGPRHTHVGSSCGCLLSPARRLRAWGQPRYPRLRLRCLLGWTWQEAQQVFQHTFLNFPFSFAHDICWTSLLVLSMTAFASLLFCHSAFLFLCPVSLSCCYLLLLFIFSFSNPGNSRLTHYLLKMCVQIYLFSELLAVSKGKNVPLKHLMISATVFPVV